MSTGLNYFNQVKLCKVNIGTGTTYVGFIKLCHRNQIALRYDIISICWHNLIILTQLHGCQNQLWNRFE